jgi:hypothetical protein
MYQAVSKIWAGGEADIWMPDGGWTKNIMPIAKLALLAWLANTNETSF